MRRVLTRLVGIIVGAAVAGGIMLWASPRPRLVLAVPNAGRDHITAHFVVPEQTLPHPRWLVVQELAGGMRLWVFDREAGVLRGPWTPPLGEFQVRHDAAGNLLLCDPSDFTLPVAGPPAVPRFRIDPVTGECNPFVPPHPADAGESIRVGADEATGELLTSADQSPGGWWDAVRKWAGRPPVPPRRALVWYDWRTDSAREIPVGRGEVWSVACQPGTVCVILDVRF